MAGVYKFLSIHSLNNSVLSGVKAMPLKDSTSDNTSTFSRNRNHYPNKKRKSRRKKKTKKTKKNPQKPLNTKTNMLR